MKLKKIFFNLIFITKIFNLDSNILMTIEIMEAALSLLTVELSAQLNSLKIS